jgi:hypothetical protein
MENCCTHSFTTTRLAIEAIYIKTYTGHLMNGCAGI